MTTFQSRPDPVNFTPVDTPMPFYRTIGPSGALGLAGPHVLFLLTVPRAPRVSLTLTFFLANRRPCPRSAATRPLAATAPHAPPLRRRTRLAPPRPRLARASPAPRLRCLLHALAAPVHLRRPHRAPPPPTCSAAASQHLLTRVPLLLCPTRAAARALSHSLHPLIRRTQGARGIAS